MHPYMADVAKRRRKLVPSLQYFTCILYYTTVGTIRPQKWKLGQKYRFEATGNEMVSTVDALLAIDLTRDFNDFWLLLMYTKGDRFQNVVVIARWQLNRIVFEIVIINKLKKNIGN